jgi:hypothetical protein
MLKMLKSFLISILILNLIQIGLSQSHIDTEPVHIMKNELEIHKLEHVIGVTSFELEMHDDNYQLIARNVQAKMNDAFGGRWLCFYGSNGIIA